LFPTWIGIRSRVLVLGVRPTKSFLKNERLDGSIFAPGLVGPFHVTFQVRGYTLQIAETVLLC
jgi:hypothetical protein